MIGVEVQRPEDWRAWRDLRLEALKDTPIGFGELHADALLRTDEQWQERMGWPGVRLLAYQDEVVVGMAGGFHDPEGIPALVGVYVRPAARGQGVLAVLVDLVAAWAAPNRLTLDVHEDNHRARAAYLKLGFVETGERTVGGGIDGRDLVHMLR